MTPPSFTQSLTHNILWAGLSQYTLFALGIIKTIILYRYIGPEYAGLIAGAVVWASYFSFARFELRPAILNNPEAQIISETQFWLENLTNGSSLLFATVAYLFFSPFLDPQVWILIFILLGLNLIETVASTSRYLTEKRLRQDIIGRWTLFASLLNLLIPITLALAHAPLPALIMEIILPTLIPSLGTMLFIKWHPVLLFNFAELKKQWHLGFTLWTTALLGKITFQLDDWLVFNFQRPHPTIWLAANPSAEGFYARAYNAGKMPLEVMGGVIGTIALSTYAASYAQNLNLLYQTYQQLTRILIWIIALSSTLAFLAADEIVLILFGELWQPLVPLFRLMFFFIIGRPIIQNNGQLLIATKREKDFRFAILVQALLLLLICPPAVYFWGAAGAAAAVSLMSLLGVFVTENQVRLVFQHSLWRLYLLPFATSLLLILSLGWLTQFFTTNIFYALVFKSLSTCLVFSSVLLAFEKENLKLAWLTLRQNIAARLS